MNERHVSVTPFVAGLAYPHPGNLQVNFRNNSGTVKVSDQSEAKQTRPVHLARHMKSTKLSS